MKSATILEALHFEPLTKDNWSAFELLFGTKGACGGGWCMSFRLPNKEWEAGKSSGENKQKMKSLVDRAKPTGILAFYGQRAIAWAALAPRSDFQKLGRSRIHKPIDQQAVWSIPCTYIDKAFRNQGVSTVLLKGVIQFARKNNISILEAYPTIPSGRLPDAFAWIGLFSSFKKAGFKIVDQTSQNRPMVRYYIKNEPDIN